MTDGRRKAKKSQRRTVHRFVPVHKGGTSRRYNYYARPSFGTDVYNRWASELVGKDLFGSRKEATKYLKKHRADIETSVVRARTLLVPPGVYARRSVSAKGKR